MCATAIVLAAVAAVSAAVGAGTSILAADAQADQAKYESKIRQKQADEQRRSAEIQALQAENSRTEEFLRLRSGAMAAIGAANLGEQLSFFQGIDPEAQKTYLRDVRNVRLNLTQTRSTLADQVQVAEFGSRIAGFNAGVSKIGAIADFAQSAASAYNFASSYKTPTLPKGP